MSLSYFDKLKQNIVYYKYTLDLLTDEIYIRRRIYESIAKYNKTNKVNPKKRYDSLYAFYTVLRPFILINFNLILLYLFRNESRKTKIYNILMFNCFNIIICSYFSEKIIFEEYLKSRINPYSFYILNEFDLFYSKRIQILTLKETNNTITYLELLILNKLRERFYNVKLNKAKLSKYLFV